MYENELTEILKVNTDLMHSSGPRPGQNNARLPIATQFFEDCPALLPIFRDFAHANLVADHFDWLRAFQFLTETKRNLDIAGAPRKGESVTSWCQNVNSLRIMNYCALCKLRNMTSKNEILLGRGYLLRILTLPNVLFIFNLINFLIPFE